MYNRLLYLCVLIFLVFVVNGCGGLLGLDEAKNPPMTTTTLTGKNSEIQIDLPFELKEYQMNNIDEFKQYLDSYFNKFGYGDTAVRVLYLSYNKEKMDQAFGGKYEFNLDDSTAGVISDYKNMPGVSDFKQEAIQKITIGDTEARAFKLTYNLKDKKRNDSYVLNGIVFNHKNDLWLIATVDPVGNDIAKAISKKVRDSLKIIKL